MTEKQAIDIAREKYGSIEGFALYCLTDGRRAMMSDMALTKKARISGLAPDVISTLLITSPVFRGLLRSLIVNTKFTPEKEAEHIDKIIDVATNKGRKTVTNSGRTVRVDNTERGVIDAGRYLNEYRETPLASSGQGSTGTPVVINFGMAAPQVTDDDTHTIEVQAGPNQHRPLAAGGLPPAASRARHELRNKNSRVPFGDGGLGRDVDFFSQEAPNQEEAYETPAFGTQTRQRRAGVTDGDEGRPPSIASDPREDVQPRSDETDRRPGRESDGEEAGLWGGRQLRRPPSSGRSGNSGRSGTIRERLSRALNGPDPENLDPETNDDGPRGLRSGPIRSGPFQDS